MSNKEVLSKAAEVLAKLNQGGYIAASGVLSVKEFNDLYVALAEGAKPAIDPDADLNDYYDPMDPGYPDRGSAEAVKQYLRKRKAQNRLSPAKLQEFYNKHRTA